jgi:hypothetical protein
MASLAVPVLLLLAMVQVAHDAYAAPHDGTDAAGMAITSAYVTGFMAIVLFAGLVFMTIKLWNEPRQPSGWYPDPDDAMSWRYWDGKAWTSATASMPRPPAPAQ